MKKLSLLVIVILSAALLFSCGKKKETKDEDAPGTVDTSNTVNLITVRADSWPPYNGDPNSPNPGYMVEVVNQIFKKEGFLIDYKLMPWNRSLKEVERGKYDAVLGASVECAKCVTPKEPIQTFQNRFFVKKGSKWRFKNIKSLENKSVGVIADYSYSSSFDKYLEKNKKDSKRIAIMFGDLSLQKNIKKLLSGRVDIILENPVVLRWEMKTIGVMDDEIIDAGMLSDSKDNLYMKFSPASNKKATSEKYSALFDKGIKAMRKSGELGKILKKYNMKDWK
ncbi:MAG: amino acid ABC transporter substrate-binding protein [bacterium]|nr:amino acid ABC transporter substrate-binding protein [bacterium]